MNPFIALLFNVISLVEIALFVWIIVGLLISFNVVNRWHPVVSTIHNALSRLFDPVLRPIRRFLPDLGGIDISPIVLILLLQFVKHAVVYYF